MRHFAHNIGDYAAATSHLSFVEDAAYHRLLRLYYQTERPLPPDLGAVARLVGARSKVEKQAVADILTEFFEIEQDGYYHQKRCDREISVYQEKAEAARRNGTKGGRPPNRKKTDEVISPVQSEKLTTPHSPLPSSDPNGSGASAPLDTASIVFGHGREWLQRSTGKSDQHCRQLLGKWRKSVGDEALIGILGAAERHGPIDALAWIEQALRQRETAKRPVLQV